MESYPSEHISPHNISHSQIINKENLIKHEDEEDSDLDVFVKNILILFNKGTSRKKRGCKKRRSCL